MDHLENVTDAKFMQGIIVQNFTHLNMWSIMRMMMVNDWVIVSFVVRANLHSSTHVTAGIIVITLVQYIAVGK